MILIAGGAGAAATAFPTTGSQCSWLDAIFGSLCALLGSLVLVEPFRETVPLVWKIGRASCRERVVSVRVDLGGRRIIKNKKRYEGHTHQIKYTLPTSNISKKY